MGAQTPSNSPTAGDLDTLAQVSTPPSTGTETHCLEKLQRRACSKYLTHAYSVQLASIPETPLRRSYWNTFWCASGVTETSCGRHFTEYCKNRWCLICTRIKSGEQHHRYAPLFERWDDAQFVTLTLPNVPASKLAGTVADMISQFRKCLQSKKGRTTKPHGIRKLEVTYNAENDEYHPHFHLCVRNFHEAEHLVRGWLDRVPGAHPAAQDIRKATSLNDLVKYLTKPYGRSGKGVAFDARSLDNIFRATYRRRIVQPFGFQLPAAEDGPTPDLQAFEIKNYYMWDQQSADWVSHETGEPLSGWRPNDRLLTKLQIALS